MRGKRYIHIWWMELRGRWRTYRLVVWSAARVRSPARLPVCFLAPPFFLLLVLFARGRSHVVALTLDLQLRSISFRFKTNDYRRGALYLVPIPVWGMPCWLCNCVFFYRANNYWYVPVCTKYIYSEYAWIYLSRATSIKRQLWRGGSISIILRTRTSNDSTRSTYSYE